MEVDPKVPVPGEPRPLVPEEPKALDPEEPKALPPGEPKTLAPEEPKVLAPEEPKGLLPGEPKGLAPGEPKGLAPGEPKVLPPVALKVLPLDPGKERKEENWLLGEEGLEAEDPLWLAPKIELEDPLKGEEPDSGVRSRPLPCAAPENVGSPPSTPWVRPGVCAPGRVKPGRLAAGTPGREGKLGLEPKNPVEESRPPKVEELSGKTNEELGAPPLPTPGCRTPLDPPRRDEKPGTPLNWKPCKLSSSGALRSVVPSSRKESGPPKPGKGGG